MDKPPRARLELIRIAMARDCKQLLEVGHRIIGPDRRVDLLWVDSLLEFPASMTGGPPDTAAISCVLVNLEGTDESSAVLSTFAESLIGVSVTCQSVGSADIAEELVSALTLRRVDFANAVVWLGHGMQRTAAAQRVLGELTKRRGDDIALVTTVVSGQHSVDTHVDVDGCVTDHGGRGVETASHLFVALGSMAAPVLMSCLDAEDIRPSLGQPQQPSLLVHARWSPDLPDLHFACEGDRRAVESSRHVAAFVFMTEQSRVPTRLVIESIRRRTPAAEWFVYQVSVGYLASKGDASHVVDLTLQLR